MTTPNPLSASALTTDKTHLPAASLSRVTPKTRSRAADSGEAMKDGSFPIRDGADLKRAINAFGRAKDKGAAKRHIIRRAKALDKTNLLPDSWRALATKEFPGQRVAGLVEVNEATDVLVASAAAPAMPAANSDEALVAKADRHNLFASADRQVSMMKLKVVYRRGYAQGEGTPCVTPEQVAHSRVNAFLRTLTASVLPEGFVCEDSDLLPVNHPHAPEAVHPFV